MEPADFGADCPVNPVLPARGALPYLVIKGASDAIAYYQRVFGAQEVFRLDAPDRSVMHCEMKIGPASFMLTEERPEHGARGPLSLGGTATTVTFYVPDADAVIARAVAAGATVGMPVGDQFWGDRAGSITDPFGHQWFVATHKEEPTHDEMKQRLQKMFEQGAPACG
ncbi:VOC family protein [Ideonella sp. BN130291]|uniref:VOC family protein n=1 Tax=Ideonella sp. BN130291 TaxID=3112940 RepID=UPI002E255CD8|nr:VOC family protein [Ideonella sp. BN130291]